MLCSTAWDRITMMSMCEMDMMLIEMMNGAWTAGALDATGPRAPLHSLQLHE